MYQVLFKLYKRLSYESWKTMVDNALENKKLTEEEYKKLLKEVQND